MATCTRDNLHVQAEKPWYNFTNGLYFSSSVIALNMANRSKIKVNRTIAAQRTTTLSSTTVAMTTELMQSATDIITPGSTGDNSTAKQIRPGKTLQGMIDELKKKMFISSTDPPVSNAKIVLIIAYMRSGSSFTGGLFNQLPESFYLFEPVRFVFDAFMNNASIEYLSGSKR